MDEYSKEQQHSKKKHEEPFTKYNELIEYCKTHHGCGCIVKNDIYIMSICNDCHNK